MAAALRINVRRETRVTPTWSVTRVHIAIARGGVCAGFAPNSTGVYLRLLMWWTFGGLPVGGAVGQRSVDTQKARTIGANKLKLIHNLTNRGLLLNLLLQEPVQQSA